MYCQGLSGKQIANNWRDFPPLQSIALNWRELLRPFRAESLLTYSKFRRLVLSKRWKLDPEAIRTSARKGTFNAYNFTRQRLEVRTQDLYEEDFLIAGASLPGWFPPVTIGGSQFIDAVYLTGANLMNAIAAGADELWIIWTVNRTGVWKRGFISTYFQIIEASANGNLNRDLARIQVNNDAIDRGVNGEFGRPIKVENDRRQRLAALSDQLPQHSRRRAGNRRRAGMVPPPRL
jgi:predicted acylesterase/phospholipase RssA